MALLYYIHILLMHLMRFPMKILDMSFRYLEIYDRMCHWCSTSIIQSISLNSWLPSQIFVFELDRNNFVYSTNNWFLLIVIIVIKCIQPSFISSQFGNIGKPSLWMEDYLAIPSDKWIRSLIGPKHFVNLLISVLLDEASKTTIHSSIR